MRAMVNVPVLNRHRWDNPSAMPIIPPYAAPVAAAQIITPLPPAPQNAYLIDARYRSVAMRGAPELGNLAGEGLRQINDKVWWARGRSSQPIQQRPSAGLPGFLPSRPANNPNTKFVPNGRAVQPIRFLDPSLVPVPTPPTPQEFGTIRFPNVGFYPRPGWPNR